MKQLQITIVVLIKILQLLLWTLQKLLGLRKNLTLTFRYYNTRNSIFEKVARKKKKIIWYKAYTVGRLMIYMVFLWSFLKLYFLILLKHSVAISTGILKEYDKRWTYREKKILRKFFRYFRDIFYMRHYCFLLFLTFNARDFKIFASLGS